MEVTTSIKSFEDACSKLGLDPAQQLPFPQPASALQKSTNAIHKLFIIAEAVNEGWKPDWNNWDERKFYPWFDMSQSAAGGSGFSFDDCCSGCAASSVGSRLVFRTRELAEFAGKTFTELYREWMVIE